MSNDETGKAAHYSEAGKIEREEIFRPEELPPTGATQVEQTSPAPAAPVGGIPQQQQGGGLQSLLSSLTAGGQASASARTVVRR